jgi:imidazolonepropionase-like amidohydrolase
MRPRNPRETANFSRPRFLSGVLALCLAVNLFVPGVSRAATWQLNDVNIIDVTNGEVAERRDVRIEDDRIVAIGPTGTLEDPPENQVDGGGGYLIPGLTEMHAHVPSASQGEQRILDVLSLFLANGATTIRGMLGEPAHLEWRQRLASGEIDGPRLITSGPSFNGNTVSSPEQGAARALEQAAAGYDFLKIHPGLSREEFVAIAAAAREADIPFAGHVSFETSLETALAEGQDSIDHLDAYAEAMVPADHPLHGQPPQFFGLNLADGMDPSRAAELARATAAAGVWQVPTETLFENIVGSQDLDTMKARPGMEFVGNALLANWSEAVTSIRSQMTPAQRERFLAARRALLLELQRAGAGLLLGSDAPQIMNVPGFSLHQELALYVKAGLTPLEALQTGTINVARYFGEDDSRGRIAENLLADFVLLEANPLDDIRNTSRILGVARTGSWYDRGALERLLDGVRERKL